MIVLILLTGTAGYMVIEHYSFLEAAYMTVITVSSVGFTEVHALSNSGRVFTIFFIIVSFSLFTYYLSQIVSVFFDEEFRTIRKIHHMENKINQLTGHVIICGYGRNGQEAGEVFRKNTQPFVVIERTNAGNHAHPFFLEGDATQDEVLLMAGIKRAKAIITTLPDDADNLFVVLTARELHAGIHIISRASQDSSVKKLKTAGAHNVIMPDKIGGAHMAALVANPDIKEFLDLLSTSGEESMIREIETTRKFRLDEFDCWRQTGATLLGIKMHDGTYRLNPSHQFTAEPKHKLILLGSHAQLKRAGEWLTEKGNP